MTDRPDNDDYRPISCERYAELELHIMHARRLRVAWRTPQGQHIDTLIPEDLHTRDGAEYLVARNRLGEAFIIRLDQLQRFRPL
ncbi:transcriptional antiterminator, Rof [Alkalilimnicola ehrlichii MLHE-1]|uniref:Transcriptional antiterminator, Rof n=1 Tax=Alkalilimnicola ehrlichii (strain ATCC BAA-1101 / DSM 17681 / MLHE-1) TaxID=187272 RepID=Q0A5U7_ALKEH|nr:transcriptional antiterminator, Rof [Alkalilimnicola ehrlichii]ABI57790.1 transcriptional antiterminator, Rof [Alkalilimnicola ehrlichii MLHE-1]